MFAASCALAVAGLSIPVIAAQRPKSPAAKKDDEAAKPAAKKAEAKRDAKAGAEDDKTKPQAVDLETSDGVLIAATYFPPVRADKNTPVVILLHDYGEKQSVFWPSSSDNDLAFALQDKGYAVLTFDFRGHGHSKSRVGAAAAAPAQKGAQAAGRLDFNELRKPEHFRSLLNDIEAAKRFLVRRNNAGEINVAKLGVVGCELGASLAVLWSFNDWQYVPQPGFNTTKQGQDVMALVLISPQYNYKGVVIDKELRWLQSRVPMQVIVGKKDPKAFSEADKMYKAAKAARPMEADARLTELDVKLQGSKLLNPDHELEVHNEIATFLDATIKKKPAKWEARELSDDEKAAGQ
jgi:dienelactone hydrolase